MIIRRMTEQDLDEVFKIENELYPSPWTLDMFKSDLKNQYAFNHVLEDNGKIIGYYGCWIVIDYCTVTRVSINKENQGKHLGNMIFDHLIDLCNEKDCVCIDLEVRDDNIPALNMYKEHGFEITRVIEGYYGAGKNALNMVKNLKKEGKKYEKIHISN